MSDNDDNDNNVDFDYIRFEKGQDDPGDKGPGWFEAQNKIGFLDYMSKGSERARRLLGAVFFPFRAMADLWRWRRRN